ncbi:PEP-CTERM sorting domain-containing protein [Marinimicrobium sp. ABcell2]|uniref:PEP-CTERM sorting domain-containing protein n=1 Tax=Marinimicrobium sp. ABcell2 TaxID=3069751 RepID=UPI0027B6E5E3|nr:PEP-CTERM sorting domain-containing protein [Marinimicrobium sp. ABcell2]MDQ2076187.1 PEP-CTERM sorting domain-containing protein [Marinimicrobium sp. ABcell2]
MSIVSRSLIGTASLVLASLGATGVGADDSISSSLQSDFGESFYQERFKDTGEGIGFGRDRGANRTVLDSDASYFKAVSFYLEGMSDKTARIHPARAGSPFALNDLHARSSDKSEKYVTVSGDKPMLNESFNFDRSNSEGWGLSGKTIGTLAEPGTLLLMGLGLLGLGLARRRAASKAS